MRAAAPSRLAPAGTCNSEQSEQHCRHVCEQHCPMHPNQHTCVWNSCWKVTSIMPPAMSGCSTSTNGPSNTCSGEGGGSQADSSKQQMSAGLAHTHTCIICANPTELLGFGILFCPGAPGDPLLCVCLMCQHTGALCCCTPQHPSAAVRPTLLHTGTAHAALTPKSRNLPQNPKPRNLPQNLKPRTLPYNPKTLPTGSAQLTNRLGGLLLSSVSSSCRGS